MSKIQTVIFDYGGVLCLLPPESQIAELAAKAGLTVPDFNKHFWNFRIHYDRGDFTGAEYWRAIARAAGKEYSPEQVEEFIEADMRFWLTFDERMLTWNRMLRAVGLRTAIISNMPDSLGNYLWQRTNLFTEFDNVTLSYEVRSAKPEAKIYRACIAKLGVKSGSALFLDDKAPNVHAAQSIGMHAVIFGGPDKFSGREAGFGLPPIPA